MGSAKRQKLSHAFVRDILDYDPDTGLFTWRYRPDQAKRWNTRFAGKTAGAVIDGGYVGIRILGVRYYAHRLAWFYVYGSWPAVNVDHRDGDPSNNRLDNLRECDQSENHQNRRKQSNNSSGFVGVSRRNEGWQANIWLHGKQHWLGTYDTPEAAAAAYAEAKQRLHEFQPVTRAA